MRSRIAIIVVAVACAASIVILWHPVPSSHPVEQISSRQLPAGRATANFTAWSQGYKTRHENASEGERLAIARRAELAKLIETDPERALAMALPLRIRQALPAAIQQHLEERVSGRADVYALAAIATPEGELGVPPVTRTAVMGEKRYRMFTYGRGLAIATTKNVPIHGIAIGDALAVHESPVRVLEPPEVARFRDHRQHICPVSGKPSTANGSEVLVDVGGEIKHLCGANHIAALAEQINGPAIQAANPWTHGPKTLLYIRIKFNDQEDPETPTDASNQFVSVNSFFVENSYGQTSIVPTITPVYTLPYNTAQAVIKDFYAMRLDALAAAAADGYTNTAYDLDAIRYNNGPGNFGGAAFVGARGCWLKYTGAGVVAHELGHNYGLWHANSWNSYNDSIIGPGQHIEYGDNFDTMGQASAGINHFNAWFKRLLDWLSPEDIIVVTNSGTYRVYVQDDAGATNHVRFLQVARDAYKNYGIEFRLKNAANPWLRNGAGLRWTLNYNSSLGSRLLDTTPGTPNYNADSPVLIGQTFSDTMAGVHITPIGKGGTTPESLDVVVNLGTFPSNHPPALAIGASATAVGLNSNVTFTASASDPDGDPLVYLWNFDDAKFANTPVATKSWNFGREYNVRCTVTDMKGGTASKSVIITVGNPGTFRISGQVRDGATTLQGARVFASTQLAYSDSDGTYTIAGLNTGSYTVNAVKYDYALAGQSTVTVGPNATGIDFNGPPRTYQISGQAVDGEFGLSGVTITDGTHTNISDESGSYAITGLSSGYYTLTGSKPDYEIGNSFLNPIEINGTNADNKYFYRVLYTIYGNIAGVGTAWIDVGIGDGVHQMQSYGWVDQGDVTNNQYYLDVPRGIWNVVATHPAYTIMPLTFENPVEVSTNYYPDYDFYGVPGVSYIVSGSISNGVAAIVGAEITDGIRYSVTDSLGKYMITGVPSGNYTITPALDYHSFTPSNRFANVAAADSTGHDFVATLTPMGTWRTNHFTTAELSDPTISADDADPDGDGIPNLLEYGLDLDPRAGSPTGLPTGATAGNHLTLTFTRLKSATDLSYLVKVSADLATWQSGPLYTEQLSAIDNGTTETVTVRDLTPMSAASKRFIRLDIIRTP